MDDSWIFFGGFKKSKTDDGDQGELKKTRHVWVMFG